MHTALSVRRDAGRSIETITGPRSAWRFRPHYHAGDEIVRLSAGRARLRLSDRTRLVEAGETVVVPAGIVHRFEPVDAEGWAFTSEFALPSDSARDRLGPAVGQPLVARAIDLLVHRASLRSDAEELASECGVSAGYLARTFQRATGTGLHNFHVLMVLQKAKALLRGGAPLVDAAFDSGFCDQAHLTREFVRTYGFTPKVFRSAWAN
ncbi:MAG TPA: AraC family transcriptional regulator [Reyranella sp.]|jgi:AraC-like DNA-binding protein